MPEGGTIKSDKRPNIFEEIKEHIDVDVVGISAVFGQTKEMIIPITLMKQITVPVKSTRLYATLRKYRVKA